MFANTLTFMRIIIDWSRFRIQYAAIIVRDNRAIRRFMFSLKAAVNNCFPFHSHFGKADVPDQRQPMLLLLPMVHDQHLGLRSNRQDRRVQRPSPGDGRHGGRADFVDWAGRWVLVAHCGSGIGGDASAGRCWRQGASGSFVSDTKRGVEQPLCTRQQTKHLK
jgi:hypothetical protein